MPASPQPCPPPGAAVQDIQSRYKLLHNTERVVEWLATGTVFPVLVNISLTEGCNHKCPLCSSHKRADPATLAMADVRRIVTELAGLGVKAIGLGGGGDPTCHPQLAEIIRLIGGLGMEVSLNTNGQLLTPQIVEAAVRHCTWIRVSLDADGPALFKKTHGVGDGAFEAVVAGVRALVAEKRRTGSAVTLGATYLLGPHTLDGAVRATALARELGVDYMRLRPFFQWDAAAATSGESADRRRGARAWAPREREAEAFRAGMARELAACEALSTAAFTASFPRERTLAVGQTPARLHRACYVQHFQTVIAPDQQVYPCCMLEGSPKYSLGSLAHQTFRELWHSEGRRRTCARIDFSDCPNPCMLEKHNELLWALRHDAPAPGMHLGELLAAAHGRFPHGNFL